MLGFNEGLEDGLDELAMLGLDDGATDGTLEGLFVGLDDLAMLGLDDGATDDGATDGTLKGLFVGDKDGKLEGCRLGVSDGATVGRAVGGGVGPTTSAKVGFVDGNGVILDGVGLGAWVVGPTVGIPVGFEDIPTVGDDDPVSPGSVVEDGVGTNVISSIGMAVGVIGTGVGSGPGTCVGLAGAFVGSGTGTCIGLSDAVVGEGAVGDLDGASAGVTSVIFPALTDKNESPSSNFDAMSSPFSNTSIMIASSSSELISASKYNVNSATTM